MEETKIEWTWRTHPSTGAKIPGGTFNPWIGCEHVSPACKLCYADTLDRTRFSKTLGGGTKQNPIRHFGPSAPRYRTTEDNWNSMRKLDKRAAELGASISVFCASLGDVFDEKVSDSWRDDLFCLILDCPHLDWLILTKRPHKMRDYLTRQMVWINNTPENVYLGATMEDQEWFDRRIEDLLATPAKLHFASMEPLLGKVDISRGLKPAGDLEIVCPCCEGQEHSSYLDWVIVGGESNGFLLKDQKLSRPMHPDHVLHIATQCWTAGTQFFFKQWGDWAPAYEIPDAQAKAMAVSGNVPVHDFGHGEEGRRLAFCVGKAMAGSLLDGELRREFPAARLLTAA